MFIFGRKNQGLGIDIGTSSIKVVLLEKSKNIKLLNYGILWRKKGEIQSEASILSPAETAPFLKQLFAKMNCSMDIGAKIALPFFSSFMTVISLPKMSEEELPNAVDMQFKQYIPVPLSDVDVNWSIVEKNDKIRVLLAAVPKKVIQSYENLADISKLKLKELELENFAQGRLVRKQEGSFIILDIGAHNTNITAYKRPAGDSDSIRIVHNLDFGGEEFTAALSKSLGVSFDKAESIKKGYGLFQKGGEQRILQVLYPLMDKIVSELETVISNFRLREYSEIQEIFLIGGGASIKGIREYLSGRIKPKVEVLNPFNAIVFPGELKRKLEELAPLLSTACGLALG